MEQHKWTPQGRELLRLVENEIAQSGGRYNTIQQIEKQQVFKYSCDKPQCYFCQKTQVNYKPVIKVLKLYMEDPSAEKHSLWKPHEYAILRENINIPTGELRKMLRGRSLPSVRIYRSKIAKRMGLSYDVHKKAWA